MYNMNEFGTETMYDYYIAIKFMFLIIKLFFHLSIVYASFIIFYHELNNTKIIPNQKPFKNQNFNSNKLCIHTITLYK
jgi:hypothetical protein